MGRRKQIRETVDVVVRAKVGYERGRTSTQTTANRRLALSQLRDDVEFVTEDIRHGVGPDEDTEHWFYVVKIMRRVKHG